MVIFVCLMGTQLTNRFFSGTYYILAKCPKKGIISILLSTSCRGNELYFKKNFRDKKKEKKRKHIY